MNITIQATTWNVDNDCLFEVSSNDGEVLAIVDGSEVQDIVSWGFVHEGQVLSLEVQDMVKAVHFIDVTQMSFL